MFLSAITSTDVPKNYVADLVNLSRLDGLTLRPTGNGFTTITVRSGEARATFSVELDATPMEVMNTVKDLEQANRHLPFAVVMADQFTSALKRVKGLG